jgi:hypothetical protein
MSCGKRQILLSLLALNIERYMNQYISAKFYAAVDVIDRSHALDRSDELYDDMNELRLISTTFCASTTNTINLEQI